MKPPGLIGFAILLLYQIPFSRNEVDNLEILDLRVDNSSTIIPLLAEPRPTMNLDYDYMRPGHVVKGKDVFIKCTYSLANETHPVQKYVFFLDEIPLEAPNKYNITIYGDSIIIVNVSETHQRLYSCGVEISEGKIIQGPLLRLKLYDKVNSSDPDYQGLPGVRLSLGEKKTDIVARLDNVSLTCSVTPETTLIRTLYWLHEGEKIRYDNIDGRKFNNATINLTRIAMNQTGLYYCQAETFIGDIFSNTVPLHVTNVVYHESRATSSLNLTANLGYGINPEEIQEFDEVYMTCDITPNTTSFFNLMWFQNTRILPENVENGIIYEDTKLVLKRVKKTSSGLYSCMVDTDQGILLSGSPDVNIKVKDNITAITIVSEQFKRLDIERLCPDVWKLLELPHTPRASQHLGVGLNPSKIRESDNIYFTCEVTPIATKVRHIRWFLDDKELFRNEDIKIYNHPPTLVFPCIKRKFAGNISCMAEIEGDTSPKSNDFTLEIHEPIKEDLNGWECGKPIAIVELLHHPQFIYIDQAVRLHCHIHSQKHNDETETITWYRNMNDKLTPPDDTTSLSNLSSSYVTMHGRSLIIHRIKETDIGNNYYRCVVTTEGYPINSTSVQLLHFKDLNKIPYWKITPTPMVTTEILDGTSKYEIDDFVFFYCHVKPKITEVRAVHWFFNDQLLDDMPDKEMSIRNYSLRLNRVNKKWNGDYFCQIETDGGTFSSEPKSLKLKKGVKHVRSLWDISKPEVDVRLGDPPKTKDLYEKDNIYLICVVLSPRTIIFQLNWYHNGTQISPNTTDGVIIEDKFLRLYNIREDATGRYRCEVDTNKGYWASRDFNINVISGVSNNSPVE